MIERPGVPRRSRWLAGTLVLVLGLLVGIGLAANHYVRLAHAPYKGYSEAELFFTVERGASGRSIGRKLAEESIVSDARVFSAMLRYRGDMAKLQAGEYLFREPMSMFQVADKLVSGDVYTFSVTVPEGLTLHETAELLDQRGVSEAHELISVFQSPALVRDIDPDASDLEGYLFPSTYRFPREPSPELVVRTMVNQFRELYERSWRGAAEGKELSARELVTLASIIEKETGTDAERSLIGSVFWNRIERGMPLQSDPTIIYALKLEGRFDGNLRRRDLQMLSPYNTYQVRGLPPGPIASPGQNSIRAVLEPAETKYLYFVSKNDGTSYFSETLREHNAAVRKYQVEYFRRRRQRAREGRSP